MAESFIFSIAESLIGKLASRAYEEASRVVGVYDHLRDMENTLSFIKAVLLDAEQKQEQNHELREWLRQLKRVFADAEDILDEVECEALRRKMAGNYGSIKRKVCRFFSSSNPVAFRCRMAYQIKEIKDRLDKVAADRNKFGLEINYVDKRVVHSRKMTHSYVIDSEVIGRDHDKEQIIDLLLGKESGDNSESLSVIPIVGIGGLGKTTLAKCVFNSGRIAEAFPLRIWICVSDDFDLKQLIIKILNVAPTSTHQENLKNFDIEPLQNLLRNVLADQKFLLVMDDVWNEDRVKWMELRDLIQVGAQGSKVLVTTRSHSIGKMMGTVPSYILQGLSHQDSLSLFVKWALKEGDEKKYPDLVEIAEDIVSKCGGLPLAVRTLGSSLFSKVDINEWKFVKDNEIWNLEQKEDDILPALKLSYDQLPSYLKRCFACFALYPKDFEFGSYADDVPWEALGLLPSSNEGKTLYDVGKQCVYELRSRSFIQEFYDHGSAYIFTLHDLVHDLALYVAKDEFRKVNSLNRNIPDNVRHLSFMENNLLGQYSIPISVRTILFPIDGVGANNEGFLSALPRYRYLRVLDLSDSEYESLPSAIGKLKHLRLFAIVGNENLKRLPDSVCKLQSLQTLNLAGCTKLETLPKGLRDLISLRRLLITTKQYDFPGKEISKLTSLETLIVCLCENMESLFEGLQLPSLKVLGVYSCQGLKSLQLHAKHVPNLEGLSVRMCPELELSKGLDNRISELRLKELILESLPQLVTFPEWLRGSSSTLTTLFISDCVNLEELPEWLSDTICLKKIVIVKCPKLIALPDGTCKYLEELHIVDCPELCKRYERDIGQYWPIISHIEVIEIGESIGPKEE